MGICLNVYRRGAVYWWRYRFGPAEGGAKVRDVALSLRTCDPRRARSLGVRLNAEAEEARRALREGGGRSLDSLRVALMQAAEDLMRGERIVTEQGLEFEMSGAVLDGFFAAKAERDAARPTGALTIEIERRILGRIGRDAAERLDRKMAALRSALTFDSSDGQEDDVARAMDEERALAVVCRLLAFGGSSARVDERCRADLAQRGFEPSLIQEVAARLHHHARGEQYRSWTLGATYEQIVGLLRDAGVDPTEKATARLRRNGLLLLAEMLEDVDRRYHRPGALISAVYADLVSEAAADIGIVSNRRGDASPSVGVSEPKAPASDPTSPSTKAPTPPPAGSTAPAPAPSFIGMTEGLVAKRMSGRKGDWDIKTANQHRAAARLLVKQAGIDDPRLIKQAHIGAYFDLLAMLPKNYGKSSKDVHRSLEEILARAEDLDDDEIGLEAGTVNRHQTQLGTILKHMRGYGFDCGEAFSSFRRAESDTDDKRRPFSQQDGFDLFSSPIYQGFKSFDDRLSIGDHTIHDALYWVPLIGWYGLLRLSEITGLLLSEIDLKNPAFQIETNKIRRIKNPQSKRRIAIHPELLRLGILDYVEALKSFGHELLFPDLQMRGSKTPLSAFFYKDFKPMLDLALPHAAEQKITFHSTRKTGNTAMVVGKVLDVTRLKIMGHAPSGVNGKHYTAPLPDSAVLEALSHIPVVTHSVRAYDIRLSPPLSKRSVH